MLRALYAGLALPTGTIREPRRVRPMRSNAEDGAPNERLPKRARTGSTHVLCVCHDDLFPTTQSIVFTLFGRHNIHYYGFVLHLYFDFV